METKDRFTHIAPELIQVFEELRRREPIFHTRNFGITREDFEQSTAPDFWEVGASGRRYSRRFILENSEVIRSVSAVALGWECSDFGLRQLSTDTYLLTYTLRQSDRLTRRSTIWQSTESGWQILYHQGTIVAAKEDDILPS